VTAPFTTRATRAVLTLAATALLLALLVRDFGGSGEFARAVLGARPGWVAIAFGAASMCVALGAWRWSLVLAAMGYRLPFRRSLEVLLAVWPLAVVTPSRTNELLRPLVVRDLVPLAPGAGSVLAEKAIDLFVLLVMAALGVAAQRQWTWTAAIASCALAEAAVVALIATRRGALVRLPLLRRRPETVEELFGAYDALRRRPAALAKICGVSMLVRLGTLAIAYALLVSVDANVDPLVTATLWPAAMVVGLAPLTLAGMGTRDAAFIYLLEAHGVHASRGAVLAATMGYSAVGIWSFAVLGLPLLLRFVLRDESVARRA
jgi:uncharacterized membrane protein YbhN (UPF0104 family)